MKIFSAVSTNQISLTWSNPLSNTNISFTVQRRTTSGSYSNVVLLQNALSYLDSGLPAGTQFFYRVKGANYAGESSYSPETNATTFASTAGIPLESLKVWLKADCGHGGRWPGAAAGASPGEDQEGAKAILAELA